MNLTITALLVRDRKSGEVMPLVIDGKEARLVAFVGGLGSVDARQVAEAHERLRAATEEGRTLRAKYSHALFMVENIVRASYEFPDESQLERDAVTAELLEARRQVQMSDAELAGALAAVASVEQAISRRSQAGRRVLELEGRLGLATAAPISPEDNGGQSRASDLPPGGPSAPVIAPRAPHSVPQENGFVPSPETGANGLGNAVPAQPAVPVDEDGKPAAFPGDGKTISTDPRAPRVETDRGETVEQPKPEKTTSSGTLSVAPAEGKKDTSIGETKTTASSDDAGPSAPTTEGEIVAPDGQTPARDALDLGTAAKRKR